MLCRARNHHRAVRHAQETGQTCSVSMAAGLALPGPPQPHTCMSTRQPCSCTMSSSIAASCLANSRCWKPGAAAAAGRAPYADGSSSAGRRAAMLAMVPSSDRDRSCWAAAGNAGQSGAAGSRDAAAGGGSGRRVGGPGCGRSRLRAAPAAHSSASPQHQLSSTSGAASLAFCQKPLRDRSLFGSTGGARL